MSSLKAFHFEFRTGCLVDLISLIDEILLAKSSSGKFSLACFSLLSSFLLFSAIMTCLDAEIALNSATTINSGSKVL